ncbi:WD40-repeat-containing domain protein [Geopyxis carbonaria]|nr:WD40-repeat-containing domain protein [Geopyxis carbonaria]
MAPLQLQHHPNVETRSAASSQPPALPSPSNTSNDCDPRPTKRKRTSLFNDSTITKSMPVNDDAPELYAAAIPADTAESVKKDVGPFLKNHIPQQYAPQGTKEQQENQSQNAGEKGNTRYCYRHRPDIKCRRPADEPTMEQLQNGMETLPAADQQAITHVWTLFSAAPSQMRKMMLQGILQQCCFPQLSYLSTAVRELIRIDFLNTLPLEISFKILSYLDTASLCKAAQVSRTWRMLADDDVVWHKMCEQHIDRKCDKCGWGLPLLERKRLRASKRQMELRAQQPQIFNTSHITTGTSRLNIHGKRPTEGDDLEPSSSRASPPSPSKRPCQREESAPSTPNTPNTNTTVQVKPKTQPWKKVFSERYKVELNWRRGRCTKRIFKGHSDGIMCLQFDDQILATGSYDSTIKIWDIDNGEEISTLTGHTSGVRCLQFDDTKLISGSMDRTLKIWNYRTGQCISTLQGHTDGVVCLHFDSTLLVSGSVDKTIKVWNFADKSCFALKGHSDWVNSVRIDSDSRTIFSASDDQTVKMWDLDTRTCVRTFEGHVGHVQQVIPLTLPEYQPNASSTPPPPEDRWNYRDPPSSSSPPSKDRKPPPATLITAALDGTVKFWDVASGRCLKTLFGHVEGVWALAADTLRIISGAQDAMVKVWDVNTGSCLRTVTGHIGPVTCVGLADSRMVTGGEDCIARLYCFKDSGQKEKEIVGQLGGNCEVEIPDDITDETDSS